MKHVLSALALTALMAVPALAATKIDDPVKFVQTVYAGWSTQKAKPEDIFTARLEGLRALDEKEAHGEVGRGNDFSFWCNCQDGEIKSPTVKGWAVANAPDRKVVEAKFLLDSKKQDLLFYFERTKAGWKIDDVQSRGADAWTLSVIYKYGSADGR